jgi:GNAT superfamily N-acetyltransferase
VTWYARAWRVLRADPVLLASAIGAFLLIASIVVGPPILRVALGHSSDEPLHRAEIQRLVVRADARGHGVGRALMTTAVEHAQALGLRLLWLSTHAGTDADRIYERLGWTRSGEIPDYAVLPNGDLAANAFYLKLPNIV